MVSIRRRWLLASTLATGLCVGSAPAAGQADFDLPIREHIYANGLRLLVWERPGDPRVAAKIFTDMGGLQETPGDVGAAHFLEHLMFKGTHTLGTTDWQKEKPIAEAIDATERAITAELNRARNQLQERGVFHDYAHARTTPRLDSLRAALAELKKQADAFRDNGAMTRWYQAYGGALISATTEQEWMKFDASLPKERVALFLRVEADRMRNGVFREFEEETRILVEQRIGDLNRGSAFNEAMSALVGVAHPVFWDEGFYPTDFEQYTRAYQRALYETNFVPNNSTIVLVGGVTLEAMVPLVEHYFGWMPRAPEPPRVKAVEPLPRAERRLVFRSDWLEPRVEARFMVPGVGHPDRPAFDVLAEVIELEAGEALRAAGVAGRVDANFRVVHAPRFGVPASMNVTVLVGDEAQLESAERTLLPVLERLRTAPAAEARVALAKKRLRVEWLRTQLDADRLGFEIGHFQIMDEWRTLERFLAAREQATADDLRRVAERYFIPENRSIGVLRRPERKSGGAS